MSLSAKMKVSGNKFKEMRKNLFILLLAFFSYPSCHELPLADIQDTSDILSAGIEQLLTRTDLDENNNIRWSMNDQIIGYIKSSYGYKYQVKPEFIGKTYASFSKVSSNLGQELPAATEFAHIVAYYPFSESAVCMRLGEHYQIEAILPYEQTYVPNSFGNSVFPMVAVSPDNNITFKNICGGLKLQFKGSIDVASIRVEGNNDEKLSGSSLITAYSNGHQPELSMSASSAEYVILKCEDPVSISEETATDFIIVLPPTEFTRGFKVTVVDSDNQLYTIETSKSNTVIRSCLLKMPVVTLVAADDKNDNSGMDMNPEEGNM